MTLARFGAFEFNSDTGELSRGGETVRLEPQPSRILAILLARPGELITREALCEAVWGGSTFVDFEHGLNYAIRQVRTALGDAAGTPQYIETLRGRGYRFIGTLEPEPTTLATARRSNLSLTGALTAAVLIAVVAGTWLTYSPEARDGVGVSLFTSATGDDAEWVGGLRSEVVARLSQWNVKPVVLLDGPDKAADTRWRLDTAVATDAGQVRTTVTIVDTRDQSVRWSDTFSFERTNLVDNRNGIASKIALAVRLVVLGPDAGPPPERLPRRPRT